MMLTMTSWRGLSVWMNLLIDDSMSWPAGLRCLCVPMEVGAAGRAVRSRAFSTRRRTAGRRASLTQSVSGPADRTDVGGCPGPTGPRHARCCGRRRCGPGHRRPLSSGRCPPGRAPRRAEEDTLFHPSLRSHLLLLLEDPGLHSQVAVCHFDAGAGDVVGEQEDLAGVQLVQLITISAGTSTPSLRQRALVGVRQEPPPSARACLVALHGVHGAVHMTGPRDRALPGASLA